MKQQPTSYSSARSARGARGTLPLIPVVALALAACGQDGPLVPPEPDNVPPALAPIPGQRAVLNTLRSASVVVALDITDPDDDRFTVTVASDDEAVLATVELTCGSADCLVTLEPSTTSPVELSMTVSVDDGSGGRASGAFTLTVGGRLVTSAEELGSGTLADAVEASEPGDVIAFDTDGAFSTPRTIELFTEIVIDHDLTVGGPGADRVSVSGSGVSRVFRVDGGAAVTVTGLGVVDGVPAAEQVDLQGQATSTRLGGGFLVTGGSRLTLEDVIVTGGATPDDVDLAAGGGVANLDATLVIVRGRYRRTRPASAAASSPSGRAAAPRRRCSRG